MIKMIILGILLGQLVICSAISLESAEEGPCFNPPPRTVSYDAEAFGNTSVTWYHVLWSKYYLYRVAADVTRKDYSSITDDDLRNSCFRFSATGPGSVAVSGANGQKRTYELGAGSTEDSFRWKASGNFDWDGEARVTKAGPTYFVVVTCFTTNQIAFTVGSRTGALDPQTKAEVINHVQSLGFSSQHIYEPSLASCPRTADQSQTGNFNGYIYARPSIAFRYPSGYNKK